MPHGELPGLLGAADVMALASANEGLANAWVEALACGTPIVIPDVGGASEVVTERAYGRIVGALRRRVRVGHRRGPRRPHAARPRSARGAERFTWEANTAGLYEHLAGLVQRG